MPWMILLSGGLALASLPAQAGLPETPRPAQLSVIDGLPSNVVYDVAQDQEGYLWFATADGLARYDGHGFRVWRRENGLRDNAIDCVYVDAHDRVWIGSDSSGVAMLDKTRGEVVYTTRIDGERIDTSPVWDVLQTGDGDLWIGTDGAGLVRVHDGHAQRFLPAASDAHSLPGEVVTELALDVHGELWVATNQGAARWNGSGFERVAKEATASPYITGLVPDRGGGMWLRSVPGGAFIDEQGRPARPPGNIEAPGANGSTVMEYGPLLQDREGGYWLQTSMGLTHRDDAGRQVALVYSNLSRSTVRPQYERALADRDGGLWFTSEDAGVWHLPSDWRRFALLTNDPNDPNALHNAQVYAIAAAGDGDVWLGGTSGILDRLDPETGKVHQVWKSVPQGVMYSLLESSDGAVWIGLDGALARFDPHSGALRKWTGGSDADASFEGDVEALAEDADHLLWSWHRDVGLQARTLQGRRVESVPLGEGNGLPMALFVHAMRPGPEGALWLAGSAGLLAWDKRAHRFVPVPGVDAGEVDGFAFDANTLWLARVGEVEAYARDAHGAWRLRQRFGAGTGMPQMAFGDMAEDHRGVLWLSSARGLVRADPAAGNVRVYGIEDGLPGQEILAGPVARIGDGRLIVASTYGAVVFDPVAVRPSRAQPHLTIDTLAAGHGNDAQSLPVDAPFRIGYDSRDLRVVARLLSYDNVLGNRYRFRLRGFDEDWVETGSDGERTFSRLPPGKYVLQVEGFNADSVASPVREMRFEVTPPWWQRWWAIALFALALLLLLLWSAGAYRHRLRRSHALKLAVEKHRLAEQASLAKTQFLATLGHEVRTPMTGVLGMSELLLGTDLNERQRGYAGTIQQAGKHLLRLVNDALDLARIEAGKLELQAQDFDLRELVAGVVELIAPLAARRGLDFASTMEPDAPVALRGDAMRVRQILLNLFGNAVKFTESGSVGLRVQALEGGGVRLLVSDTGPGLDAEQQARLFRRFVQAEGARTTARYGGSGLGLAICQELAVEMGGRISVDSAPGQGTRFLVELPLPVANAPVNAATNAPASTPPNARALDVLLVEDDDTVAEVMTGLLHALGHRVERVVHGLQALAAAITSHFDIALLDLDLPGMNGLELAQQLRGLGFAAPLLAVTARADADAEPQAKAAGFDGFARKPLTGEMLWAAMKPLLVQGHEDDGGNRAVAGSTPA